MWHRHFSARCHFIRRLPGSLFLIIKTSISGLKTSGSTWSTRTTGKVYGRATSFMTSRFGSLDLGGMVTLGPLAGSRTIILSLCPRRRALTTRSCVVRWFNLILLDMLIGVFLLLVFIGFVSVLFCEWLLRGVYSENKCKRTVNESFVSVETRYQVFVSVENWEKGEKEKDLVWVFFQKIQRHNTTMSFFTTQAHTHTH